MSKFISKNWSWNNVWRIYDVMKGIYYIRLKLIFWNRWVEIEAVEFGQFTNYIFL